MGGVAQAVSIHDATRVAAIDAPKGALGGDERLPARETVAGLEKGKVLRFQAADAEAQLKRVILVPQFWFAWSQFRAGTRVYSATPATP